jgi:glutamyl-tRNA(Gln) amidotransferase subunit E
MLPHIFTHPKMQFDSVLNSLNFKRQNKESIFEQIPFLHQKFQQIGRFKSAINEQNWIMGQLRGMSIGNMPLVELKKEIKQELKTLKN